MLVKILVNLWGFIIIRNEDVEMKKLTKKRFKETVQLWIEMAHFAYELDNLVEDSDEVGEIYEYDNWFANPQDEEVSIMGLHVAIENAQDIASTLEDNARVMLKQSIMTIINHGLSEEFFGQAILNINDGNLEALFELLIDEYDEIYNYTAEIQYDRFIKCLLAADDTLARSSSEDSI